MGDALAAADAAAQASTSHRLAGQRGSALTASARATLLANDCGGAVSPVLAAGRAPLPLTRREHEIAKLLSDGLSNRDIAEATSLSIRTVEGHIYQPARRPACRRGRNCRRWFGSSTGLRRAAEPSSPDLVPSRIQVVGYG
jgi:DNA-binding NarL/FixJ family response regulator